MKNTENVDVDAVLVERGERYGVFSSHSQITQRIKRDMRDSPNWDLLCDYQREALEMIAHKIGRILNGDPSYLDSWVDISGYTKLVIDKLSEEQGDSWIIGVHDDQGD